MKTNSMKSIYRAVWYSALILTCLLAGSSAVFSQNKWNYQDDGCGAVRWFGNPNGAFNLEIKEQSVSQPPKQLSIDGQKNGGVRIRGWERDEILIRACVQVAGENAEEARALTAAVRIEMIDGRIRAVTPNENEHSFGVNYDIRVPVKTDLTIKTHNGGINLSNINGSIIFDLNNGGAIFDKIKGDVRGQTVNGNLTFNLSGDKWEGGGVNARTTNGNVLITVPENYSAQLETGTRRGNFYPSFPVEKTQSDKYELNFGLGTGGATIRTLTTNGQITIKRQIAVGKEN